MRTITIEVEDELHAQLTARATAEGQTAEELVLRAATERIGRPAPSASYGFSAQVETLLKPKPDGDFYVLTITMRNGDGRDAVYAGRVRHNVPQDASVSLWVQYTKGIGTGFCPVAIPRSVLTSAQEDPTATLHKQYVAQGYRDGNAAVLALAGLG